MVSAGAESVSKNLPRASWPKNILKLRPPSSLDYRGCDLSDYTLPALGLVPKLNEVEDIFLLGIGTAPGLELEHAELMST